MIWENIYDIQIMYIDMQCVETIYWSNDIVK